MMQGPLRLVGFSGGVLNAYVPSDAPSVPITSASLLTPWDVDRPLAWRFGGARSLNPFAPSGGAPLLVKLNRRGILWRR